MQVVIFEELGAVLRRQHKNVKEEKKRELKKIGLLIPNRLQR